MILFLILILIMFGRYQPSRHWLWKREYTIKLHLRKSFLHQLIWFFARNEVSRLLL